IQRQALHAKTLSFIHPVSQQKVVFDSELPEDMAQVLIKIPDTLML
ncbi:MAG: RluA family pseudouridine synthase, partial [Calditrichales bacterium]